jgi:hypothetical protein
LTFYIFFFLPGIMFEIAGKLENPASGAGQIQGLKNAKSCPQGTAPKIFLLAAVPVPGSCRCPARST